MKNHLFWLFFILAGVIFLTTPVNSSSANGLSKENAMIFSASLYQADQTPTPTVLVSQVPLDTPESRELPPVGRNAGLVIGASVLVLIIIGGVLGSRRKEKH
jgi:drug/metabolite transporter (DMT)-like permease